MLETAEMSSVIARAKNNLAEEELAYHTWFFLFDYHQHRFDLL